MPLFQTMRVLLIHTKALQHQQVIKENINIMWGNHLVRESQHILQQAAILFSYKTKTVPVS